MGKISTITKDYMSVPEYFADCFNYYFFNGKQVVKPNSLHVLDPTELAIIQEDVSEKIIEKIRDVFKQGVVMTDGRRTYLLLGIENQTEIHYAMPVKNMIYDALDYGTQVSKVAKKHREERNFKGSAEFLSGFTKDDKLKPVITLTIYFGADEWDGPRSLKEMFEETDEELLQFVEDYRIHLIVPREIKDFSKFETDFGKAMKYIAVSKDKNAMKELQNDRSFEKVDVKTVGLLNACTGSNITIEDGEGEVNMCIGLEGMKEDARLEERTSLIMNALRQGSSAKDISTIMGLSLKEVKEIEKEMRKTA